MSRRAALAISGIMIAAFGAAAAIFDGLSWITAALGVVLAGTIVIAYAHSQRIAERRSREASALLDEIVRRQRRDTITLTNVAGTTGRMAPRVRTIEQAVAALATGPANVTAQEPRTAGEPVSMRRVETTLEPEFPAVPLREWQKPRPRVKSLVILDEFSSLAFSPEWDQTPADPSQWRSQLRNEDFDLLFVESAWNGNDGLWLYHLTGATAPRPALVELVEACRKRRIPTVFWNKEDPPHFDDFIGTAALFDYVFTSDERKVPEYRTVLRHDRVGVLPFAAQPKLHNPARVGRLKRDLEVAFGGMYFRHKYPERRKQLDMLLPAAARFKLDIFSRHAEGNENYQFPPTYQPYVRGTLPYPSMITAYHRYKVFLNVNSVVGSPSMCARRIFEITACGAAVVTPPTPAIDRFFPGGEIAVVHDEEEATRAIKTLVKSDGLRDRRVHVAQRRIWEHDTYTHRVGAVLEAVGIESRVNRPSVSVLLPTVRPQSVSTILANARRQHEPHQLVLGTHGFDLTKDAERELRDVVGDLIVVPVERSVSLGAMLNILVNSAEGDVLSKMDDDDFYGKNYLRDLVNIRMVSQADIVGKAAAYIYFQGLNATALSYGAHEHRFTDFVRGATLTGSRDLFKEIAFADAHRSEDSDFLARVIRDGGSVYAADRFNFYINRIAAPGHHTWDVGDDSLLASSVYQFSGRPDAHVAL